MVLNLSHNQFYWDSNIESQKTAERLKLVLMDFIGIYLDLPKKLAKQW